MGYKVATLSVPAEVASGTPPTTLMQIIAATNTPVYIKELSVSLDGTTEVEVLIQKQTTAGTMTSLTPRKQGSYSEALQTTASHTATAEPTAGNEILRAKTNRGIDLTFPPGDELIVAGGERLGITINSADAGVNCLAWVRFEE